jgi:hypothetical protein
MKKFLLFTGALLILCKVVFAQEVVSPNGKLKMLFSLNENGSPTYQLTFNGKEVIKTSTLGLELKNDDK